MRTTAQGTLRHILLPLLLVLLVLAIPARSIRKSFCRPAKLIPSPLSLSLSRPLLDRTAPCGGKLSDAKPLAFFFSRRSKLKTGDVLQSTLAMRGGSDTAQLVDQAYEWATNLGAPAALVAGAIIATLYESMGSGNLDIEKNDETWVKMAKKATRLFLLVAFILQIICIFTTTILGTHLLSLPPANSHAKTPLEYLRDNFEFEYLTSRIAFLQGLVTWLAAIALEHFIPQQEQGTQARRQMDILIASSLSTLIIIMMSFYNGHMNFYQNYGEMLCRYGQVMWLRFVWVWPPKPLTVVATPSFVTSVVYFFKVFLDMDEVKANTLK